MEYCQSCFMPMVKDEDFGTDKDGSKNHEYCIYCYKDGEFTFDGTMEEMIDICVPHMVNNLDGMTEETARKCMSETFPKLKRWKKD